MARAVTATTAYHSSHSGGLRFREGGKFFNNHALRFGLAAGTAAGKLHHAQRHHALGFQTKQRSLRRQPQPRVPHLHRVRHLL